LIFSEVAVPLLAAIFFEINALVIATMIAAFIAHQLTALWDVTFANDKRQVTIEQQAHSSLELMPLMAIVIVIILHWSQFLSLWGLGSETARYRIVLKPDPLPWTYVAGFFSAVLIFKVLPYLEELVRGLRSWKRGVTADREGRHQDSRRRRNRTDRIGRRGALGFAGSFDCFDEHKCVEAIVIVQVYFKHSPRVAAYGGYRRRAMMKPSRKAIARDWRGVSRVKFAKRSRGRPGWRPASMASAMRWLVVSTASVAVRTASVASPSLVDALAPDVSPSPVI
jgi:hypothetical protein